MSSADKAVATAAMEDYLDRFPAEFVIAENDLATVVAHELRGKGASEYSYFSFHTFRIVDDQILEHWSNSAVGSGSSGTGRRRDGRQTLTIGAGDPSLNKRRVSEFYRVVFDGHNAGAVKEFVAEDYHQHSSHLPEGRAGLEGFVRSIFPDGPVPVPEVAALPPTILMGEGDVVVIAAAIPQSDGAGGEYLRLLYDGYRLRDGLIAEHWSGIDPRNPPTH